MLPLKYSLFYRNLHYGVLICINITAYKITGQRVEVTAPTQSARTVSVCSKILFQLHCLGTVER